MVLQTMMILVQINHPGRQSPIGAGQRGLCQKNIAPSAIGLNFGDGLIPHTINAVVFGTPREMTIKDIEHVINAFVDTALLASKAGFAGVEVHAAHGYLLSQFLSSQSNKRTDDYGGSPTKRARIVVEILRAIRSVVPREFCVGIKLNSVDHQSATDFQGCLEQLRLIADTEIDFLEISGGSYENPTMNVGLSESNGASNPSSRTVAREAFFLEFAQAIRRDLPDLPLMVTGGFRTRRGMETAISSNACDLVGLGRPAVMDPKIPKTLFLNPNIKDEDASISVKRVPPSWAMRAIGVKALGAGTEHVSQVIREFLMSYY
ncbi:hypothetical protein F4810DRAFT_45643 [Camillea tinctor]|nr:hypothetical protein F4810DRAFT_45643 [Camillea tinctor]